MDLSTIVEVVPVVTTLRQVPDCLGRDTLTWLTWSVCNSIDFFAWVNIIFRSFVIHLLNLLCLSKIKSCQKDLFPKLNPKDLPIMLPPCELFAMAMDEFGIRNDDHIVVYGREGSIFTPRTWFLFRTMGHEKVTLMQGSLEDWKAQLGPVEEGRTTVPTAADIIAKGGTPSYQTKEPTNVVTMNDMVQSLGEDVVIVDPRGSSFAGKGYIPGAIHVPYSSLLEKDNYLKLKSKRELLQIFDKAGVDVHTEKKIIATCGSGVSVCHILLALEECGRDATKPSFMYDGSWAEWGSDPDTPKILPGS